MTQLHIATFTTENELPALTRMLALLGERLGAEGVTMSHQAAAGHDALLDMPEGSVRVVSLAHELANAHVPWAEAERMLEHRCAALCERGDPVVIMTVFRHVDLPGEDDHTRSHALRVRIRRLNFLATELSRRHGVFVADLDRILADTGGVPLRTDYRLGGDAAVELAAQGLAQVVVNNALDAVMPFEAQERVMAALLAACPVQRHAADVMPQEVISMGRGRRRQIVTTITDTVDENHMATMIRRVLRGEIPPRQAFEKLVSAVRKRGLRDSIDAITSGMFRLLRASAP
ncbi:SGNH/GDSL hydrolase family protein [Komagataeibacter sp. FNDCR2]|uniref:SGNH/GDSL hydrolase family protein n=1 Tax=Komagataeibacter sp. FNDCR2 TaxID=2878682 RepID=UPI001E635787|nr:SGNH/GDSL hydrolase family protein [Komagataeibacter sp. FNDCR2]MCE2574216.1 SGNH/GDSL hydrolase family protein [Komagataeibacter sp. FNDCR2]